MAAASCLESDRSIDPLALPLLTYLLLLSLSLSATATGWDGMGRREDLE